MAVNRRLFVRCRCSLPVQYAIVPGKASQRTTARNVSGSGMNLFVASKLTAGTRLHLHLLLPGRPQPVVCVGQVMWSGELIADHDRSLPSACEAGVQFIEISPEDQAALVQYATAHAPDRPS